MEQLLKKGLVTGFEVDEASIPTHTCEACIQAKMAHRPFPKEAENRSQTPGERIISDVWGPARVESLGKSKYYISFTDDAARLVTVSFLKEKGAATDAVKSHSSKIKLRKGKCPTYFRFDNGKEYVNEKMKTWAASEGITIETTAPYSPSQNGIAERFNRTLMELARAMLIAKQLPVFLWAEAVAHAAYIRNRCPTKALDGKTPYEAWHGRKPDVSHLREFGSKVWILIEGQKSKLTAKAQEMMFVGFDEGSKAIRYYDKSSRTVKSSRNFAFNKEEPLEELELKTNVPGLQIEGEQSKSPEINVDSQSSTKETLSDTSNHESTIPSTSGETRNTQVPDPEQMVLRKRSKPVNYKELHNTGRTGQLTDISRQTKSSSASQENVENESSVIAHAMLSGNRAITHDLPNSIDEAKMSSEWPHWQKAIEAELEQLERLNTWEWADLPKDRSAIGSRWVFDRKKDKQGNIIKYKARLVAQGFSQRPGIDFKATFAPVMRLDTLRIFLALAAKNNWELRQMDIKGAYLWAETEEDLYMQQPPGYNDGSGRVKKLKKTIYGLKQAGNNWNRRFDSGMKKLAFQRLRSDYCAYIRWNGSKFTIILVWVDDLILISNTSSEADQVEKELSQEFDIKLLGEPALLLGIQVTRDRQNKSLSLCQSNYIGQILKRMGMEHCNTVSTPMDRGVDLGNPNLLEQGDEKVSAAYAQAIGSLLYCALCTRPDIAFSVHTLAQYTKNPSQVHWTAVKRVFRYLKGTQNQSLTYGGDQEWSDQLATFCDADWASNPHRKSISGYIVMLAGGAVAWSSKKQTTIALSTAEAEYVAATHAAKQILWQRSLLEEASMEQAEQAILWSDNQAAIAIAKNPEHHARTKHIDINLHFLRDYVESGTISIQHVSSKNNIADILTKALSRHLHQDLTSRLGVLLEQGGVLSESE
jgi:hypothetical protein